MARKKEEQQTIINISEMKCEVDYDKLADAIVKAQAVASKQTKERKKEKITLKDIWREIVAILCNKRNADGTMTTSAFAMMNYIVFGVASVLSLAVSGASIAVLVVMLADMVWTGWEIWKNIVTIFILIVMMVIALFFFILFRGVSNEMQQEEDKSFLLSVFSGIVSFAALIVALISLLREVH